MYMCVCVCVCVCVYKGEFKGNAFFFCTGMITDA